MRIPSLCLSLSIIVTVSLFTETVFGQPHIVSDKVTAALDIQTSGLVGVAGVAAQDMDSGVQVLLNPDAPFPMASTYKIPIAIALLSKVDAGELSLEDII